MKNAIKLLFVVLASLVLFTACASSKEPVPKEEPPTSPDFKLQDINLDTITLSSYRDTQPVLLFFWTTWCPFCQKELRILSDMYAGLTKDGIEVLSIDVGESPDRVEQFVRNYALAFRVLLDKDTSVSRLFDVMGVPTYVLIDTAGNIVFSDNFFPQSYRDLIATTK